MTYVKFPINNIYLYKTEIISETHAPSYTMGRDLVEDNSQFSFTKHFELIRKKQDKIVTQKKKIKLIQ